MPFPARARALHLGILASLPVLALVACFAFVVACGGSPPAPKPVATPRAASGPVTAVEWKDLCEAQAERARRCPGPIPEPVEACTERASCFGALVRPDVIRALAKCQSDNDCTRACSIERVTAALPPTEANTALEEACAMRQTVCPSLDCAALVVPVRSLDVATTRPLVACMKFERSCLDAAACVLEKMAPALARVSACGPGALTGEAPAPEGPSEAPPAAPR